MVQRNHKQLLIKFLKWILYFAFVYGVFILLNGKSQLIQREEPSLILKHDSSPSQSEIKGKVYEESNVKQFTDLKADKNLDVEPPQEKRIIEWPQQNVCPGVPVPSSSVAKESWEPVDGDKSIFVFSAYYVRERNSVFVIAIRPMENTSVLCQLWAEDRGGKQLLFEQPEALETEFFEFSGYEYSPTVFRCILTSGVEPKFVSIVERECSLPLNILQIQSASKTPTYKRRLTVCLSPLKLVFNQPNDFIEWVELNRAFGVEKITVYNYSSGPDIVRLLKHYSNRELVEVVEWNPPVIVHGFPPEVNPVQLGDYGTATALNDCLFRNKKYSEFITNIDTTELLVTRAENETVIDMINSLNVGVPAYHIGMAYRRKVRIKADKTDTNVKKAEISKDTAQTKTTIHMGHSRGRLSKVIVRTADVDFILPEGAPGVESFMIPFHRSVLHKHTHLELNQMLGTGLEFEGAIPEKLLDKVKSNIKGVQSDMGLPSANEV